MKLLFACAVLATAPALAAPARTPLSGPPVVVISIDALHPSDVLEADRRGHAVPNLRRLAKEGAFARGVKGVLPTVTRPEPISRSSRITARWTPPASCA